LTKIDDERPLQLHVLKQNSFPPQGKGKKITYPGKVGNLSLRLTMNFLKLAICIISESGFKVRVLSKKKHRKFSLIQQLT